MKSLRPPSDQSDSLSTNNITLQICLKLLHMKKKEIIIKRKKNPSGVFVKVSIRFPLISMEPTVQTPHSNIRHFGHTVCINRLNLKNKTQTLCFLNIKLSAGGGVPPLVRRWGVVQLLVFGRRSGEDGGDRQQDGGSVRVTHLVNHDGGQNQAQQRQYSQSEDDADRDVSDHMDVADDDGEAGLDVDGPLLLQHEQSVGHSLTLSLHLLHLVAQTGVGDVALPVLVTEQTTAVQLCLNGVGHVLHILRSFVQRQHRAELFLQEALQLGAGDGGGDPSSEHQQTSNDHTHQEHDQGHFALLAGSIGSQDGDHHRNGAHNVQDEEAGVPTLQVSIDVGEDLSQQRDRDDDCANKRE